MEGVGGIMITVTIWGEPHPQGRPRASRQGGFARVHEATPDTKWKRDAAKQIIAQLPTDRSRPVFRSGLPLRVSILSVFACPKSDYRKREPKPVRWHAKTRDVDNLAKIVLDAATGVLWYDDGQVVRLTAAKIIGRQDDEPRTILTVEVIDHEPDQELEAR